eukprot:SAG31_NODE_5802_length_2322_cov_2.772380_2_plen_140_part_00
MHGTRSSHLADLSGLGPLVLDLAPPRALVKLCAEICTVDLNLDFAVHMSNTRGVTSGIGMPIKNGTNNILYTVFKFLPARYRAGTGPAFTDGSPQRLKIRKELIMDVALLLVLVHQMGACASRPRHHDVKQAHLGMFIH